MRKGRSPNIQFLLQGCCVFIYIGLFVYILFKFVEILSFDDLVLKCIFFMSNKLLNIVDKFLNDIV